MIPDNNKLINLLASWHHHDIVFIPTPGKIGDALLAHSAYQLFNKYNVNYVTGKGKDQYQNKHIVIGGGGNLIGGLYSELECFIGENINSNQITIFPHTIYNLPQIKSWLDNPNFQVFCREVTTFEYLRSYSSVNENIFLVEDLSCFLDLHEFTPYLATYGVSHCNAFRNDAESIQQLIPDDNFDVSQTWDGRFWHNKNLCLHAVHSMASYLSSFEVINTDRLHTAILAGIIGKNVNLYTGSYHKIKSVYDFSIKDRWPNIQLIQTI